MKILMRLHVFLTAAAPLPALAESAQCTGLKDVASGADCQGTALPGKVSNIIDTLFIVAGAIAVIIIIIAGIRYITSTGDSTRIQQSKDTLLYAVIGLVVVILARAIVGYVINHVS